jgi:DNA-binding protein H-NS
VDERKRDSMVAYLRRRMDEFGITLEDLASSLARDESKLVESRYRSATGDTWDGTGEMPQWLRQAMSAGQSIGHFETAPASKVDTSTPKRQIDWRNDPFAGSPLAQRSAH